MPFETPSQGKKIEEFNTIRPDARSVNLQVFTSESVYRLDFLKYLPIGKLIFLPYEINDIRLIRSGTTTDLTDFDSTYPILYKMITDFPNDIIKIEDGLVVFVNLNKRAIGINDDSTTKSGFLTDGFIGSHKHSRYTGSGGSEYYEVGGSFFTRDNAYTDPRGQGDNENDRYNLPNRFYSFCYILGRY